MEDGVSSKGEVTSSGFRVRKEGAEMAEIEGFEPRIDGPVVVVVTVVVVVFCMDVDAVVAETVDVTVVVLVDEVRVVVLGDVEVEAIEEDGLLVEVAEETICCAVDVGLAIVCVGVDFVGVDVVGFFTFSFDVFCGVFVLVIGVFD